LNAGSGGYIDEGFPCHQCRGNSRLGRRQPEQVSEILLRRDVSRRVDDDDHGKAPVIDWCCMKWHYRQHIRRQSITSSDHHTAAGQARIPFRSTRDQPCHSGGFKHPPRTEATFPNEQSIPELNNRFGSPVRLDDQPSIVGNDYSRTELIKSP
jgi:hypothetical protein